MSDITTARARAASETSAAARRNIRTPLAALCLYLAGSLYLLAQVLPSFGSSIPGSGIATVDAWQNTWNLWWVRRALAGGQNPYVTDMIYYPYGQSLYLHTLNITNALLSMPVQLVAGPIAAYNAALILGFVLTGFATYLLASYLVGSRGVAVSAGAIFTFGPFHVSKLWDGHLTWVTVFWIPLFMYCTLRALDSGSNRWRVLAGLVLAGSAWTSYYYPLFSFIFVCLLLLVRLPAALRDRRLRSEIVGLAVIGGVAAALAAPLLVPALLEYRTAPQFDTAAAASSAEASESSAWDSETATYSADLVDIVFPSPFHPLWGAQAEAAHKEMRYGWFWTITPGLSVLALAALGAAAQWRRARPWALLVAVLWVLMLGPQLRVAGAQTGLPMPYDLLHVIPGMTLSHRPNHLAIFMLPLLAVLAAFGMQTLLLRGRWGRAALGVLGAAVAFELLVLPMPAMAFPDDPVLAQLRGTPGAVMDLPNPQRNAPAMINQLVHGRPIVGGYVSRQPGSSHFTANIPWVRQIWRMRPEEGPDIVPQRPDDGRQALSFYGLRTIVVRREDLRDREAERLRRALDIVLPGIQPALSGPRLDVYQIEPVAVPRPFLFVTEGWHDRERSDVAVWRWMSAEGRVSLVNPTGEPRTVTLELTAQSYGEARPLEILLDGRSVGAYEVPPALQTYRVALTLAPGEHTLLLKSAASPEPPPAQRQLSIMVTHIDITSGT